MSARLRKYATALSGATLISAPMVKAGSNDLATGSDWTPSAGDCKVSIDGGAQANIGTLPTYTNGQWLFTLSGTELTGKKVVIVVVDSATKVVEDQFIDVETYGHASAMLPFDLGSATVTVGAVAAAASNVKKNTALAGFTFVMTDATTHAPKTGLTITATRSLDGGAFGACANSASEIASGAYKIDLAAADLNANTVMLRMVASGADDLLISLITQP